MSQELTAPDKVTVDPIATALVAAGVPSSRIESLATEYADLVAIQTIPDGDDELYERVHKADMACRDVESTIEAVMKELRDDAVKWQRFVLKEERARMELVGATRNPLKKLKADYKQRAELRVLEESKRWAEKMNLRKSRVFALGYRFDGNSKTYELPGFTSLTEEDIVGMGTGDEKFDALLSGLEQEVAEHRERQEEAARTAKIAADALAAQQAEETARLKAERAELDRKQQEMNQRLNDMRKGELRAIGCVVGELYAGVMGANGAFINLLQNTAQLYVRSDEEWESDKLMWAEMVRDEERKAKAEQAAVDTAMAASSGISEGDPLVDETMDFLADKDRVKALSDAIQGEGSDQGDRGRILHIVDQLNEVIQGLPEMNSAVGQHTRKTLVKQLGDIVRMLETASKDL